MIGRGAHPLAWSLLVAVLGAGACAPEQPLRVPPADGSAAPDAPGPADGGTGADATGEACPAKAPAPSGTNEPGDFCSGPADCQREGDEIATCWPRDLTDAQLKVQRCHRYSRAQLGEPCAITVLAGGQVEGPDNPVPDAAGFCDLAQGLVCDSVVPRRCRARPTLGQSCTSGPYCTRGSFCEGGTCKPGRPLDASCQGSNDFTDQPECDVSAHCDIITNKCVPRVPESGACDYDPQCTSGVCRYGVCAPAGTCPAT